MKIIIEIPEKTNAHIRSDYGHGVKGLEYEDMLMLCDAVYHGEPYHNRPHGKWLSHYDYCKKHDCIPSGLIAFWWCNQCEQGVEIQTNFCPNCGADMRESEKE